MTALTDLTLAEARDAVRAGKISSVELTEAFIGAMGLQRPVLIGHSMGGRNAMLLTRRRRR